MRFGGVISNPSPSLFLEHLYSDLSALDVSEVTRDVSRMLPDMFDVGTHTGGGCVMFSQSCSSSSTVTIEFVGVPRTCAFRCGGKGGGISFGVGDSVGSMFAVPLHSFTADHSQVNLLWLVAPVSGGDKSTYAHVSIMPT